MWNYTVHSVRDIDRLCLTCVNLYMLRLSTVGFR